MEQKIGGPCPHCHEPQAFGHAVDCPNGKPTTFEEFLLSIRDKFLAVSVVPAKHSYGTVLQITADGIERRFPIQGNEVSMLTNSEKGD